MLHGLKEDIPDTTTLTWSYNQQILMYSVINPAYEVLFFNKRWKFELSKKLGRKSKHKNILK